MAKMYRVQYWKDTSHNVFYHTDYEKARMRYLHWTTNQLMELDGIVWRVKLEELCRDGKYRTIFESKTFHDAMTL